MREEAKAMNLPPKYNGKWAKASQDEVEAELAEGKPYTYRFRVASEGSVKINDLIRGEVSFLKEPSNQLIPFLRGFQVLLYSFLLSDVY